MDKPQTGVRQVGPILRASEITSGIVEAIQLDNQGKR